MSIKPFHLDVVQPDGDKSRIDFGPVTSILVSSGPNVEPTFIVPIIENLNGFSARKTSPTSIPTSASIFRSVPFSDTSDSPFNDPGNNYSSPTFTVGTSGAGFYDIHAIIDWDTTGVVLNTLFQMRILMVGPTVTVINGTKSQAYAAASFNSNSLSVSQIQLSVGDTVTVEVSQNSGNSINVLGGTFGITFTSSS